MVAPYVIISGVRQPTSGVVEGCPVGRGDWKMLLVHCGQRGADLIGRKGTIGRGGWLDGM